MQGGGSEEESTHVGDEFNRELPQLWSVEKHAHSARLRNRHAQGTGKKRHAGESHCCTAHNPAKFRTREKACHAKMCFCVVNVSDENLVGVSEQSVCHSSHESLELTMKKPIRPWA